MRNFPATARRLWVAASVFTGLLISLNASAFTDGADRTVSRFGEYAEWTLTNSSFGGNPYDVQANAVFVHDNSGERRTTPMFYAGANQWKFRFTGTRTGRWSLTTVSNDPELNGASGSVNVIGNSPYKGFVQATGGQWTRSATGEAFVPQYVMYAAPHYFRTNTALINADIDRYLKGFGFTGFHIPVYCRWFDINEQRCSDVGDANPDPATFDALEAIIQRVYQSGETVHLWAWGDSGRQQNLTQLSGGEGGINGPADLRLQRYIAARLGPLPGWTMGYGYDLFEWVGGGELTFWRNNMNNLMGWSHLLGARGSTNSFAQPSEAMDFASYETHRPTYSAYRLSVSQRPNKPAFSEDRFRFRGNGQRAKDYTLDEMRLGMWHSAIAGGVANIWGNSTAADGVTYDEGINEALRPSNSFSNADALRTYRFFVDRYYELGMINCDQEADAPCQRRANNSARNLFKENANNIQVDLSGHTGARSVTAVDTRRAWAPVSLGNVDAGNVQISLPYVSDWAVSIGGDSAAAAPVQPPVAETPAPPPITPPTPPQPPEVGQGPGLDTNPPAPVRNLRVD